MAALNTLTPDLRAEIPELPSFVAERYLLRTARTFMEQAQVWRTNVELPTTAGTATISLASVLPENSELVELVSIQKNDGSDPLQPRTYAWLDGNRSDWRTDTNDAAAYYVREDNDTIRLVPIPANTETAAYYARIALKPTLSATTLNDLVSNKYSELMLHGTLGMLFSMPRKPWSDEGRAVFHTSLFEAGIPAARREAADEFENVPRTVKYGGL